MDIMEIFVGYNGIGSYLCETEAVNNILLKPFSLLREV